MMEVLKLFAPYGPAWLGGVLLTLVAFYFGVLLRETIS